jgi:hypothetical protein
VVHLLIREGRQDAALKYLSSNPQSKLAINNFTEGTYPPATMGNLIDDVLTVHAKSAQPQGRNIRAYAEYLIQRAKSYGQTKVDFVRVGDGRLKKLTVDKGLLMETEQVQEQVWALLQCDVRQFTNSFFSVDLVNGTYGGNFLKRTTKMVRALLNNVADCNQFLSHEAENEITITAFRLLTMDLIALYYVMNEGTMSVLGE